MAGENDLILQELLNTGHPVDLVLGAMDEPEESGPLIASTAPRAALRGTVFKTVNAVLSASIKPRCAMVGVAVVQTAQTLTVQAGSAWERSSAGVGAAESPWHESVSGTVTADAAWAPAHRLSETLAAPWAETAQLQTQRAAAWQLGSARASSAASSWQETSRALAEAYGSAWQRAAGRGAATSAAWQEQTLVALQQLGSWEESKPVAMGFIVPWGVAAHRTRDFGAPWQLGRWPDPGVSPRPVDPPDPEPHVCYVPPGGGAVAIALFEPATINDTTLVLACEGPAGGVFVPIRRVYIVENNVSLHRVSDGVSVPVLGMTLTLDVDSWTWGFTASLPGSALALVDGIEPVELEALINGNAYRVLVESRDRDRTFGRSSLMVRGRGRAAALDEPYAPIMNFGNASDRTAQQLMGDALDLTGWTVDWQLDDWLVPAGVWSFQGSRIGALAAIAAAAGGYLQPHPTADVLRVLHRYPSAPWEWGGVVPDFTLPAAVVQAEGIAWSTKAAYNRVFVAGTRADAGVLAQVTRSGTAGDVLAPMVTNALMTTAGVARQRGRTVLSDTGRQARVKLRMPVLSETGIILPGKFVRYEDTSEIRSGIVRSIKVEADFPEVWQTLEVESHV